MAWHTQHFLAGRWLLSLFLGNFAGDCLVEEQAVSLGESGRGVTSGLEGLEAIGLTLVRIVLTLLGGLHVGSFGRALLLILTSKLQARLDSLAAFMFEIMEMICSYFCDCASKLLMIHEGQQSALWDHCTIHS
jgi:hypothetical protein